MTRNPGGTGWCLPAAGRALCAGPGGVGVSVGVSVLVGVCVMVGVWRGRRVVALGVRVMVGVCVAVEVIVGVLV